ncbi:hypothetical protein ACFV0L_03840 [Streptosporangium canum]|uniref:hypothetical protein n=1 Tax=Streptosporangium canum TaxID=324952 RepID=UPI0036BDF159
MRAAGQGRRLTAAAALAGLAVLSLACLYGWAVLLKRRLTTRRPSGRPARATSSGWATGPMTAIAARELRTWSRDLLRFHYLCYALVFCLLPLAIGAPVFLPWTGLVFALWTAAISANLYGEDGTELWGKTMIPGAARHDIRGRQLAWLLITAPPTVALTLIMLALTGQYDLWPWLAALVPALLGGGAGVTVLVLTAATAAPAYFAVQPAPAWAGPAVGLISGAVFVWLPGHLAAARLESSAPELLHRLRTGLPPERTSRRTMRRARTPAPVSALIGPPRAAARAHPTAPCGSGA